LAFGVFSETKAINSHKQTNWVGRFKRTREGTAVTSKRGTKTWVEKGGQGTEKRRKSGRGRVD